MSVGGNDLKIKDFELRAKPPQGPQAQALTVSDSPVYRAFTRHEIYNPDYKYNKPSSSSTPSKAVNKLNMDACENNCQWAAWPSLNFDFMKHIYSYF